MKFTGIDVGRGTTVEFIIAVEFRGCKYSSCLNNWGDVSGRSRVELAADRCQYRLGS